MNKLASILAFSLLATVALPGPAGATAHRPDVGVELTMERLGSDVRLRAVLENEGDRAAKNVRLHLTLPPGAWSFEARGASCAATEEGRECRLQELGAGKRWTLNAVLRDAACESRSASARVQTPSDQEARNDQDRASVDAGCPARASSGSPNPTSPPRPPGTADVSVRKFGTRSLTEIRFSMVATNEGPRTARRLVLVDELPDVGFPWIVHGPDQGACTLTGLRLECRWAEVPVDELRIVRVSSEYVLCGEVTNTVRIDSADDPNASNDVSTARAEALC